MLAYLNDDGVRQTLNRAGQNCWEVYIAEMLGQLGYSARRLQLRDLEKPAALKTVSALIVGAQSGFMISNAAKQVLDAWVQSGGILIGFATFNMYGTYGVCPVTPIRQTPDDYAVAGKFTFHNNHPLTREIHPIMFMESMLLILSDIDPVYPRTAEEVARLCGVEGQTLNLAAVTWRAHGRGFAGYFTFDAAKTVWLLHQGRPLPDETQQMGAPKSNLQQVIGDNSAKVPYADEILLLIQNMLAQKPLPSIYPVPPEGTTIPEALFFWSGDEYKGPVERSLFASDYMRSKGLPYHINIMSEHHPMTRAQFNSITRKNGHEVSVYYYINPGENASMTRAMYRKQSDVFYKRFGIRPGSTLNGQCNWKGWSELPKWMAAAGGTADNTFIGVPGAFNNYPSFGLGFGTGFPYFFYDGYVDGNRRINLIEQPLTCYELGHRGSIPPYTDKETFSPADVHLPIDMAAHYHWNINWFYHPVYVLEYPLCRKSIEEILRYIKQQGLNIRHLGASRAADWWHARARSSVRLVKTSAKNQQYEARCTWPEGMVIRIPAKADAGYRIASGSRALKVLEKTEFGRRWLLVVVPPGQQKFTVTMK